jgi:hypothetical protein
LPKGRRANGFSERAHLRPRNTVAASPLTEWFNFEDARL